MKILQNIGTGIAICALSAGLAFAQSPSDLSGPAADKPAAHVNPAPKNTAKALRTRDDMLWYRSFTLRSADVNDGAFLPLKQPDMEIRATSQWGITIGLEEQDPILDTTDRMSAGAFFDITPRIRLGGELTFTAPGELRISTPHDRVYPLRPADKQPVVRVESSIKF